jgi:hypothetical protein
MYSHVVEIESYLNTSELDVGLVCDWIIKYSLFYGGSYIHEPKLIGSDIGGMAVEHKEAGL